MKLENQELIQEFYKKNEHKYGHLTFEQVKDCCMTPYVYARKEIESGRLPVIRLKYFGTFLVYPKRATTALAYAKTAFEELRLDAKRYFELKSMIEKFLDNEEQKKIK